MRKSKITSSQFRIITLMRDGYSLESSRTFRPEWAWLINPEGVKGEDINVNTMYALVRRKLIIRGEGDTWELNPDTLEDFIYEKQHKPN